MAHYDFNHLTEDMQLNSLETDPVSLTDLVKYAGAGGDFNPIHHDENYARKAGLDGVIAHGMFVMGQISRAVNRWFRRDQISSFGVKFRNMTFLGERLVCNGNVKKIDESSRQVTVAVEAKSSEGQVKAGGDVVVQF